MKRFGQAEGLRLLRQYCSGRGNSGFEGSCSIRGVRWLNPLRKERGFVAGQKLLRALSPHFNNHPARFPASIYGARGAMLPSSPSEEGMRRRQFLGVVGGAAAWPAIARAQQKAMPTVGLLSSTSSAPYTPFVEAVFEGLKSEGYIHGKNVVAEQRWAEGDYDRLPAYANDLVRMRASVIVAISPPAARAAKAATSSIPIVFSTSGDPVALGLVSSLNRPGGNLTGVNFLLFEMVAKRLELLTKLDTTADAIGILVNPNNPSTARSIADAQAAAQTLGKRLIVGNVGAASDISPAFAHFVGQKARAISIEPDPFLLASREEITAAVAQHGLPAIYPHREYVETGGLISYGTNLPEAYRQIGIYAGRILKGELPANLPVMQATKFELVINTKAAKDLKVAIPPGVLALADEVIE